MNRRPPEILEKFVSHLIPRSCRENVANRLVARKLTQRLESLDNPEPR
jgi:hypothetical protein